MWAALNCSQWLEGAKEGDKFHFGSEALLAPNCTTLLSEFWFQMWHKDLVRVPAVRGIPGTLSSALRAGSDMLAAQDNDCPSIISPISSAYWALTRCQPRGCSTCHPNPMRKTELDFWRTHLWRSCRQVHTPLPVSSYSCWACSHQKWTPHTAEGSGCRTSVEKIPDTNPPSLESNNALSRKLTEKGLG